MQEWDRLIMLLFGLGAAVYTSIVSWRLWGEAERRAAVGIFCLGLAAMLLPVALAAFGG